MIAGKGRFGSVVGLGLTFLRDSKSSVCPSVRDVEVCVSHRLEYFKNTAE